VNAQKRVFVNGKKLLAEPSMSGYEAFYARAHAASKRKPMPPPPAESSNDSIEPDEVNDKPQTSKGYLEIDLSRIKDKLEDGYERFAFGSKSRKFDGSYKKDEGRLGMEPFYAKAGVISSVFTGIVLLLCAVLRADAWVIVFMVCLLLLSLTLAVISRYEIRFDRNGFSTRLGKRMLHDYRWSDVTDVQDGKKIWVKGKRLWMDPSFEEFPAFYKLARVACKGKGKPTPPSEKKRKSRQKPPVNSQ
jgi:hypothetical protein